MSLLFCNSVCISEIDSGFTAEGWSEIDGKTPDILVALETVVVLSN